VLVNPVSGIAPGIFRQIFEIGPEASGIEPHGAAPAPVLPAGPEPDIGQAFPPMTADQPAAGPAPR